MNGPGWNWFLAVSRPAVPKLTLASAVEIGAALTASAVLALLVALAGTYLPDPPTVSTSQTDVLAAPQANVLLICTEVAEGLRCIEEAT